MKPPPKIPAPKPMGRPVTWDNLPPVRPYKLFLTEAQLKVVKEFHQVNNQHRKQTHKIMK
jgi:hypothetical protein